MSTLNTAHNLSPVQAQVIQSLASGSSIASAARASEIARGTIYNWLKDPSFSTALETAQSDYTDALRATITELRGQALAFIGEIMADRLAPPSVRLKAALSLLNFSTAELTNTIRADLPPLENPELNTSEHNSENPSTAADPTPDDDNFEDVEAFLNTIEHSKYKSEPIRVHKISRNAPCPCGSGKKHKRCCLGKPPVAQAA